MFNFKRPTARHQWKYLFLEPYKGLAGHSSSKPYGEFTHDLISEYGKQGWELVTVTINSSKPVFIFKRLI